MCIHRHEGGTWASNIKAHGGKYNDERRCITSSSWVAVLVISSLSSQFWCIYTLRIPPSSLLLHHTPHSGAPKQGSQKYMVCAFCFPENCSRQKPCFCLCPVSDTPAKLNMSTFPNFRIPPCSLLHHIIIQHFKCTKCTETVCMVCASCFSGKTP